MIMHNDYNYSQNNNNNVINSPYDSQFQYSTVYNNYSPPPNRIKKMNYNNFINYGFGIELSGLTNKY